jgi:hypothetical protein
LLSASLRCVLVTARPRSSLSIAAFAPCCRTPLIRRVVGIVV